MGLMTTDGRRDWCRQRHVRTRATPPAA